MIGTPLSGIICLWSFHSFQGNVLSTNPFATLVSMWPFVIALVLLLLGILWYQNIKNLRRQRHSPRTNRHRGGSQSLVLLGIVTVFAIFLLATPYYLEKMNTSLDNESTDSIANLHETVLTVTGMDCGGCESLIERRVGALEGVQSVSASMEQERVIIQHDSLKVDLEQIALIIEESGYTVVK